MVDPKLVKLRLENGVDLGTQVYRITQLWLYGEAGVSNMGREMFLSFLPSEEEIQQLKASCKAISSHEEFVQQMDNFSLEDQWAEGTLLARVLKDFWYWERKGWATWVGRGEEMSKEDDNNMHRLVQRYSSLRRILKTQAPWVLPVKYPTAECFEGYWKRVIRSGWLPTEDHYTVNPLPCGE
jgi:hypothetical protein